LKPFSVPLQTRSIRFRLAAVLLLMLLLVVVLGVLCLWRLSDINRVSADIRGRLLLDAQTLGDLNNYTSDFRTAEADHLLAADPAAMAQVDARIRELDANIGQAQQAYAGREHDRKADDLYAGFGAQWTRYRQLADRVLALSRGGDKKAAIDIYVSTSRAIYDRASDTLGDLTDHNVAVGRTASESAALAYRQALALTLAAMLFAALIAIGAIVYIGRAISGPLHDLANAMRRLAANETGIVIPLAQRNDEIGELARTVVVFRDTAIKLALSHHALGMQATMLQDKLDHERSLATLQRDFVSMASHEFRTPLTVIDGHAQRLIKMRERLGAEEIGQRAGKVRAEVARMTNLITTLLDSSRLIDSEGGLIYQPVEFDLAALVRETSRTFRELAPGLSIADELPTSAIMRGDARLLQNVFDNLLSNAVKYSPRGGVIRVTMERDAAQLVTAVADAGLGVPAADLPQLFNRYHRGSNVTGIPGTGVGLYLVRAVVDMHGGEIEVQSEEGKGSTFTVRLPVD
jgi:two-component system OmpR family sensor kinase